MRSALSSDAAADNPMRLTETGPGSQPSRCGARTRSGAPCKSAPVTGRRRCRMHGGADGSGGLLASFRKSFARFTHFGEAYNFFRSGRKGEPAWTPPCGRRKHVPLGSRTDLYDRPLEPAALFGHGEMSDMSPLSGVKRKSDLGAVRSAFGA